MTRRRRDQLVGDRYRQPKALDVLLVLLKVFGVAGRDRPENGELQWLSYSPRPFQAFAPDLYHCLLARSGASDRS